MDELTRKIEAARPHLHVDWDADHAALLLVGMRRRARRRSAMRASLAVVLLIGAGVVGAAISSREEQPPSIAIAPPPAPPPAPPIEARVVQLGDGSTVTPIGDAKIVLESIAPDRVIVDHEAGLARFDVLPLPQREFVVSSGDLRIIVVGGGFFTLERSGDRTRVAVDRGSARVEWKDGSRTLAEGEAAWFPRAAERADAPKPWKALAERGEYHRAYEALKPAKQEIRDEAAELLMAADVARLSGHPVEAAPYLRQIVDRHASDPRAPLAAFTLGRVLLELSRNRDAARAFADAERMDPEGSLAEDALVREIDAWTRAGERGAATEAGQRYFARFPEGRRSADVQRLLK